MNNLQELNILALHKGDEKYIFVYDDEATPDVIQTFQDYAKRDELSFNWSDASVLTQRVREIFSQNHPS